MAGKAARVAASESGQRASFNWTGERTRPRVLAPTAARGREVYTVSPWVAAATYSESVREPAARQGKRYIDSRFPNRSLASPCDQLRKLSRAGAVYPAVSPHVRVVTPLN